MSTRQAGGHAGLHHEIDQTYNEATLREDVEACDLPADCTMFPVRGMQVHTEYTLYGHFFFLDQESGIRAACLAAFQDRVVARQCDAFYVRINKTMTNDQKEKAMREVRKEIEVLDATMPYGLSFKSLRRILIAQAIPKRRPIGPWKDLWADVLSGIKSEPEKMVGHLTDFGDYDIDHLAALFDKASLHGIDRFFAQVRNSLSLRSRAPNSACKTGRKWSQRNAYNPEVVAMLLDIYRVHYNYLEVGEDKHTPAMRLGLAKSKIRLTEILTFEK